MKAFNVFACIILILGTTFHLSWRSERTAGDKKPIELVFITTCVDEDFFIPVKNGMAQAASLMEVDSSFTGTKDVDAQGQVAMVRSAIKRGVDGIALSIIDTAAFDLVVKEALVAGIPVVAFNVDDNRTPNARLCGICQNFYKAGYDLGMRVKEFIPDYSTVLMTLHSENISALDERLEGVQDAMNDKNIKFKVVITGYLPDSAAIVIGRVVNADPEIKAIICTGQADTEGAGLSAIKLFGTRQLKVAGFDLSPGILKMIKEGHILCTIDQQPFTQGFYPVIQLSQYIRYGLMPGDIEIATSFVTKDNAEMVENLCKQGLR